MDSISRFTLLPTPIMAPGTCLVSGSVGPVIDTGYQVPWFPANAIPPRVYLSVDVVREMAEVAGVRDVKSVGENVYESNAYNQGFADAVKERVGDQLIELVDRLGLLAALLAPGDGAAGLGAEGDLGGAGPAGGVLAEADRPDGGDGGPSGRPRRGVRRADVPGNPAPGAA